MTLPAFDPAFPIPLIATVAGAAALFTIYRAFAGRRLGWLQVPAVLLRLVVIALLTIVLLNPSQRITLDKPENRSLLLIDRSSSMKLATGEQKNRWTDAREWVRTASDEIRSTTGSAPSLAVFDAGWEGVPDQATLDKMMPQGGETRMASALAGVFERGADESPQQIIVVSDGRAHDLTELTKALAAARDRGAKIATKLVGTDTPPRNAWIAAVQAPRTVRPKAKVAVHVELDATGISPKESLALVLSEEGGKEVARTAFQPGEGGTVDKTLNFEIGMRTTKYSLRLVPAADEVAEDDNRFGFTVEVSSSKLRVLFVEGTHVKRSVGDTGHWYNDMELMTKAWDATGEIEYECLTPVSEYVDSPNLVGVTFKNGEMRQDPSKSFPSTREDLYRFDVMLISDVPVGNFSEEQMQWVVDWVTERGGGFLMGGGYTTFDVGNYDQTPWERIIPVDMLSYGAGFMEKPFPIRIPDAVRNHPLWHVSDDLQENERALTAHPIFTGMNRVKRAKPGAIVLAVRADTEGDEPVIAAQNYGRGRSIAWLPDPNGGWARHYVSWGPPGGPRQGQHTELGHGKNFRFKEASANSASGPPPPHPSPWYGQYWVNLVKWLGEPSVRWHRDKLAGRAKVAAAKPGSTMPVAAEVLSVTKFDELLGLDVGARLDIPGSPRVRLEYDRDQREFIGQVPVPASASGEQVTIYFDVVANGSAFTDSVPVSLRHSNREFSDTAPDANFMNELAIAGAGKALDTPSDAAEWIASVAEARARQAAVSWNQPLWPKWPLLAAILALLSLEWLIRRRTMLPAAVVPAVLAFALIITPASGAEAKSLEQWISQLGAEKVRERDEAEDALLALPDSMQALMAARTEHPKEEGRLRATNLLRTLRQNAWVMEREVLTHVSTPTGFSIIASPDGRHFFTRGEDDALQWDVETMQSTPLRADLLGSWTDDRRIWAAHSLAIAPDSKRLFVGSDSGRFSVFDLSADGKKTMILDPSANTSLITSGAPTTHAAASPDGKHLATVTHTGRVYHWNPADGSLISSERLPAPAQRIVFSPDSKYLALAILRPGIPDVIKVQRTEDNVWTGEITTSAPLNSLVFSPDGTRLAGGLKSGAYAIFPFKDGVVGRERVIYRGRPNGRDVRFSKDGKSLFVCGTDANESLAEVDSETGELLWKAPNLGFGCARFDLLGDDRIVASYGVGVLRVWKRRQ